MFATISSHLRVCQRVGDGDASGVWALAICAKHSWKQRDAITTLFDRNLMISLLFQQIVRLANACTAFVVKTVRQIASYCIRNLRMRRGLSICVRSFACHANVKRVETGSCRGFSTGRFQLSTSFRNPLSSGHRLLNLLRVESYSERYFDDGSNPFCSTIRPPIFGIARRIDENPTVCAGFLLRAGRGEWPPARFGANPDQTYPSAISRGPNR